MCDYTIKWQKILLFHRDTIFNKLSILIIKQSDYLLAQRNFYLKLIYLFIIQHIKKRSAESHVTCDKNITYVTPGGIILHKFY